ncbi:ubiquitin-conjugating enzyme/RWD-like protein [Aspergillus carlsbadensis]|nr:ubiquitin-conjugating enzyme/RWD-like protein [Aspergillus carlsbadensis]
MAQNSLLPPDLIESQLSTIDLLTAMFPSPGEIEIPTSTQEAIEKLRDWCQSADGNSEANTLSGIPLSIDLAVHVPIVEGEKTIQVNIYIPLYCPAAEPGTEPETIDSPPPPNYTLRQPDWMSKAEVSKLSASMPPDDIFEALEYIREEGTRFLEDQKQQKQQEQEQNTHSNLNPRTSSTDPLVRVWFYFPSLSTREKRTDMVTHAPDYALTGFVLAGKPGVLCLEGSSRSIDAYMSFIKTHSWGDIPSHQKKVSERYRETGDGNGSGVERVFSGMEEITDSLGERGGQRANRGDMQALEAWLKGRGLAEAFERVIF